jgi:hypothetical protein
LPFPFCDRECAVQPLVSFSSGYDGWAFLMGLWMAHLGQKLKMPLRQHSETMGWMQMASWVQPLGTLCFSECFSKFQVGHIRGKGAAFGRPSFGESESFLAECYAPMGDGDPF